MTTDKNPEKIKNLFDEISKYYDFVNNLMSLGSQYFIKILSIKALNIKPHSKVLDLATGTGDIVKIISALVPDCDITGFDFSDKMLKIAKRKNPNKKFIKGDILDNPFKNNEFDYVTICFGLRNVENRALAISEIYRILKQQGYFLHLDFGEDNILSKLFDFFVPKAIKFLGKNKKNYEYLIQSKNDYPNPDVLIKEFERAGFKKVSKKYFLFKTISCQIMQKI